RALTSAQIQAIANPSESGVAAVEIAFLHAQDRDDPGSLSWQPVTLASPGAAFSTWSTTLPADLEGPHQVYLRTTDGLGHTRVISNVWQGEIDTQAPRATLTHFAPRFPGDRDLYACWSEDYNLSSQDYECPVTPLQAGYQDAAWYTELFPQTKLWRTTSPVVAVADADAADTLTACDLFGACTTVNRATQTLNWTLGVAIFTPTHTSIFTSHAPIEIGGAAYAQANLNDLSLTANGQVIYTHNWGGSLTTAPWTATFTPNTDGAYTLLATIHDAAARVITSSAPLNGTPGPAMTFYVDATPPEITLTTDRVTQANFANGYIHVAGLVNESVGIAGLEVRLNNGGWQPVQHTFQPGWQPWEADLYAGALIPPSGESYTLTARVTDMVGHVAEATRVVWADATPPADFDATLSTINRQGVRQTLMPGDVIDDVLTPQLTVEWTAASDGSGLAPYQVRWIAYLPDGTEQDARTVAVTTPRSDSLTAGEAQKLAVEVTARDSYGNETVVTVGPVYVDYQLTPVYVGPLPPTYQGWQQTTCNQVGADVRVAERALPNASLNDVQHLYAAWDAEGLRLAWTGANWNLHGDLFVYLDTTSGGSSTAYDSYSTLSDTVTLGMTADYAVWVQDSSTATLLRWNGSGWVSAAGLSYAFASSVTDLFVPFSALGIADLTSASLSLVAFANEEAALKVWAAMPSANPVNSDLASSAGWEPGVLALTAQYTWAALSDGVCPAGSTTLQANFIGAPTSGSAPLNVTFTDTSSGGATGWQWAFGDGGTSTEQHPTHEYTTPGAYTVILTVTGPSGSDTLTRTDYISASIPGVTPVADFTASPRAGQPPLTVVFTDTSTGIITGWQWAFGDGETSMQQHPTHEYSVVGSYAVTLTVTSPGGSDTEAKPGYIIVSESAIIANFSAAPTQGLAPLTVTFTDASVGNITSRQWAFGDGESSTAQSPQHVYAATGSYTVTLTVSGPGGSDTLTRTDYISVSAPIPTPVADFTAAPRAGQPPLTVAFTDTSSGDITGWQWVFGDGGTSATQHPTHEYAAVGTYTVTLTVSGPGGSDVETKANYISVSENAVIANFSATPTQGSAPLTVTFADASVGDITAWQWAFGDGGASTAQNPTHEYKTPGAYTVTLTVSGPGGSDTLTRTHYIHAGGAAFTLTVHTVGNGAVLVDPDQTYYSPGAAVTLSPQPVDGWSFAGWSGDLTGAANPATLVMDASKTVTATFTSGKGYAIYLPLVSRSGF
ncbi:MAG TPA: PKD domain-containing protein, partial [Anaerolineae bacterium]|nr:PKD domain-containing protein [Anaerolineae bacterium]